MTVTGDRIRIRIRDRNRDRDRNRGIASDRIGYRRQKASCDVIHNSSFIIHN
jgi:hypothetical protein